MMSQSVENAITRIAIRVGVERNILERLIYNESRGNINVGMDRSNYSAGIAQVSRLIWRTYSDLPYSTASKPEYFEENIETAAKFLKHNFDVYDDWPIALAAYNAGETVTNQVLQGKRNFAPVTLKYISGI